MVHRPGRLVDISVLCRQHKLEPKELRFVSPNKDTAPNILLIHCVRNGRPELRFLDPLYVYQEDGSYTDAGWEQAKTNVEKYLVDFNSNPSEEAIQTLAAMYNEDTGSKENGGLYENIYKGQMVETFDAWCFDAARLPGDVGVVKTEYGYHLIYFIGEGDSYYATKVSSTIRNEAYASWVEGLTSQYEAVQKPAMAKGRSL
jgi:hypothetical protein